MSTSKVDENVSHPDKATNQHAHGTISREQSAIGVLCGAPIAPVKPDSAQRDILKRYQSELAEYQKELASRSNHLLREVRVKIEEIVRLFDQHSAGDLDITAHFDELDCSKAAIDRRIAHLNECYIPLMKPSDTSSEIFNLWELIEKSPFFCRKRCDLQDQERLREIKLLRARFSHLLFLIGYVTGRERINEWIKCAKPGYALPFHSIFKDEVESQEARQEILNLYSLKPLRMEGGIIDPVRGVVLCYPKTIVGRIAAHSLVFLIFISSILAVYWISNGLPATPSSAVIGTWSPNLVMCWLAMLAGMIGHVLVNGAKANNIDFRQFPVPMSDWSYYFSARSTMIVYRIVLALLVFASVYATQGQTTVTDEASQIGGAFLLGYSFDSVVELVGISLEKRSSAKVKELNEKLG